MIAVPGAIGGPLLGMDARKPAQFGRQVLSVAVAGLGLGFEPFELRVEDCALKFAQPVIGRHDMVFVPKTTAYAPAVMDRPTGLRQRVIRRGDEAAFAAGEIFAGLEGERSQVTDGAGGALPIKRSVGMGRIFNHHQFMPLGDGHDGIHVRGLSRYVHRHNDARA